jgi:hypothetical protein
MLAKASRNPSGWPSHSLETARDSGAIHWKPREYVSCLLVQMIDGDHAQTDLSWFVF